MLYVLPYPGLHTQPSFEHVAFASPPYLHKSALQGGGGGVTAVDTAASKGNCGRRAAGVIVIRDASQVFRFFKTSNTAITNTVMSTRIRRLPKTMLDVDILVSLLDHMSFFFTVTYILVLFV